jgi:hypothetical protein
MFFLCGSYVNEDAEVAHRYATLGLSEVCSYFCVRAFINQYFNLVSFCLQAWQEWSWPQAGRPSGHSEDICVVSTLHIVLIPPLMSPQPVPPCRACGRRPCCADRRETLRKTLRKTLRVTLGPTGRSIRFIHEALHRPNLLVSCPFRPSRRRRQDGGWEDDPHPD